MDISVLTAQTEFGPLSVPLTGLSELPAAIRDLVIQLLTQPPVAYFLRPISYYANSQTIPLVYFTSAPAVLSAAPQNLR